MAEYKRQHTITKSYLRRFLSSDAGDLLCQYDKQNQSTCWVKCEDATVGKYVYSFQNRDGSWNHQGEKFLSEIESAAGPLLSKLELGHYLNDYEKYQIGLFIAAMVRRPRALMQHFVESFLLTANDPEKRMLHFESMIPELEGKFSKEEIANARVRIKEGALDWSHHAAKAGQLRAWFKQLPRYAAAISGMYWTTWRAQKGNRFLTSDAPAVVRREGRDYDPGIVGVLRADLKAELTLPLSSKSLLVLRHVLTPAREKASKTRVYELNARTVRMAHRFVFSSCESEEVGQLISLNREFSTPLPSFE